MSRDPRHHTRLTPDESLPRLLTVFEAATLLRTTRKAIYAMAGRGQLPGALKLGRRLLVSRDVLLDSLAKSCAIAKGD